MTQNEKKTTPSCFVTKIDTQLADKITHDLKDMGFEFSKPPYTIFSAKKKGVSVSLYQSGKLMIQGKEMGELMEFYIEPEILKSFTFSHPEEYVDKSPHIGSDEAGKGDFFGSLCVASVYADSEGVIKLLNMGIKDSKKMSDDKVLKFDKIIRNEFAHQIIRLHPPKYNELYSKFKNLNPMLAWAHSTVVGNLVEETQCKKVIIDQFASEKLITSFVEKKAKGLDLILRHKAEEDVVVAAAAVLARAAFLKSIDMLSEEIDMTLLKGASAAVKALAKKIVSTKGRDTLDKVCKMHFKTYDEVIRSC